MMIKCTDSISIIFIAEQQSGDSGYATATSDWHKEPFPTA
jgi:hypothetical protein